MKEGREEEEIEEWGKEEKEYLRNGLRVRIRGGKKERRNWGS